EKLTFQLLIPGSSNSPTEDFPQVPNSGSAKQAILNHSKRSPGASPMSQPGIRSASCCPRPVPLLSAAETVAGAPVENSVIPLRIQPPTRIFARPSRSKILPRPQGNWYDQPLTKRAVGVIRARPRQISQFRKSKLFRSFAIGLRLDPVFFAHMKLAIKESPFHSRLRTPNVPEW